MSGNDALHGIFQLDDAPAPPEFDTDYNNSYKCPSGEGTADLIESKIKLRTHRQKEKGGGFFVLRANRY
jgi:hypothetical protein